MYRACRGRHAAHHTFDLAACACSKQPVASLAEHAQAEGCRPVSRSILLLALAWACSPMLSGWQS